MNPKPDPENIEISLGKPAILLFTQSQGRALIYINAIAMHLHRHLCLFYPPSPWNSIVPYMIDCYAFADIANIKKKFYHYFYQARIYVLSILSIFYWSYVTANDVQMLDNVEYFYPCESFA